MPHLFAPLSLRALTLRNRIMMSPMCMYSAGGDGCATDWHLAHYLSRAVGGVGLIMVEATAVEPRGRISQNDLGLWSDDQVEPLARIARAVNREGAAMGVQLAHAGRKAFSPSRGHGLQQAVGPSAIPFAGDWATPEELNKRDLEGLVAAWQAAAGRASAAGVQVLEIHAAHGYLLHQFLSPLANQRTDEYGGAPANRMRLLLRVVEATRQVWPGHLPVFVRASATDWADGGLTPRDWVLVARELGARGADLVDCSSGGLLPLVPPDVGPGYQVRFAEEIRRGSGLPTAAVGLITAPEQADTIIRSEQADLIAVGRELLRNPYWPRHAARALGHDAPWPIQYERARPR